MGQVVADGFWADGLRQQMIFLGDAAFVNRELSRITMPQHQDREVPRSQRSRTGLGHGSSGSALRLMSEGIDRAEALWLAHSQGGRSMTALAQEVGLSVSRVSRLIAGFDGNSKRQDLTP